MILSVKAKPSSRESRFDAAQGIVYLKSRAEDNKANIELIKLLAKYYKVSSAQVRILKGLSSRQKLVEVRK
jgi:uncharacterized protein YggU (UPF0235/DUF167 family)